MIILKLYYDNGAARELTVASAKFGLTDAGAAVDEGVVMLQTQEAGQVAISQADQPEWFAAVEAAGIEIGQPELIPAAE